MSTTTTAAGPSSTGIDDTTTTVEPDSGLRGLALPWHYCNTPVRFDHPDVLGERAPAAPGIIAERLLSASPQPDLTALAGYVADCAETIISFGTHDSASHFLETLERHANIGVALLQALQADSASWPTSSEVIWQIAREDVCNRLTEVALVLLSHHHGPLSSQDTTESSHLLGSAQAVLKLTVELEAICRAEKPSSDTLQLSLDIGELARRYRIRFTPTEAEEEAYNQLAETFLPLSGKNTLELPTDQHLNYKARQVYRGGAFVPEAIYRRFLQQEPSPTTKDIILHGAACLILARSWQDNGTALNRNNFFQLGELYLDKATKELTPNVRDAQPPHQPDDAPSPLHFLREVVLNPYSKDPTRPQGEREACAAILEGIEGIFT